MREKNGLDKNNNLINLLNEGNNEDSEELKKIRQKAIEFNKKVLKCENLIIKEKKDTKTKVFWCQNINKPCNFCNCIKNINN